MSGGLRNKIPSEGIRGTRSLCSRVTNRPALVGEHGVWVMRVLLAGALALACSGVAYAAPTPPDWDGKPTAADIIRYYPIGARKLRVTGRAMVKCVVSREGRASECQVAMETPYGYGFGEAAMAIATASKFKPATVDGAPVDGAPISIPIAFALSKPTLSQMLFGVK